MRHDGGILVIVLCLVIDLVKTRYVWWNNCLQCIPAQNPCSTGNQMKKSCSWQNTNSCPPNYWCHIGATYVTTTCCPKTPNQDPCTLAVNSGVGNAVLQRWFFDVNTKTCKPFIYRGLKGNQNNYMTKQLCETSCPAMVNPCCVGSPAVDGNGNRVTCNAVSIDKCPSGYWCHVGGDEQTTACCPGVNVCNAPLRVGMGKYSLVRWYFNKQSQSCQQFAYLGTKGSGNNFLSKESCETTCEVWKNPCSSPLDASRRTQCSVSNPNCPAGFWCHFGQDTKSTVCCPGASDPCTLPMVVGQGQASLSRWYFDRNEGLCGTCKQFVYVGTMGNQNNFLSKQQCLNSCPAITECVNPCVGQPTLGTDGRPLKCNYQSSSCPTNYFCHVGADAASTVCCPGGRDTCSLRIEPGEGSARLPRWYLDRNQGLCGTCTQFTYGGIKGNANNFVTQQACQTACPACVNPCSNGDPIMDQKQRRPLVCSRQSPCPSSHWCHIGADQSTTVCCPAVPNACDLPMSAGLGSAMLPRWYYEKTRRVCTQFTYGGLQGSQNMFLSKSDCETICPVWINPCPQGDPFLVNNYPQECSPASPCPATYWCHIGAPGERTTVCCPPLSTSVCDQILEPGQGQSRLSRYYYDKVNHRCVPFTYRGLRGNMNNFLSEDDCTATCPVYINPCRNGQPALDQTGRPVICGSQINSCQAGYFCHIGAEPQTTNCCPGVGDPCSMGMIEGQGMEILSRWYYDRASQICRQFTYRGMMGNQNNFLSRTDCITQCPEVNPCSPSDQPLTDPSGDRIQCTQAQPDTCPSTHYCHIGDAQYTTLCCPKRGDPCEQPLSQGTGTATISRWYFDKQSQMCAQFSYKGLGGNENSFSTESGCNEQCPGFAGFCPHGTPLLTLGQPQICSVESACPQDYVCNVEPTINVSSCCPDPANFCFTERDPGPCNTFEQRFGYDPGTNTCVEYQYGGCGGTLNNFKSLERCTEVCCNEFRKK